MADTDDHGRTEPPLDGDETATLVGFLDYHRDTLAWKTGALDAAGLSTTVAASEMTLGGILKHLAYVEENWFGYRLSNRAPVAPWSEVDWDADPDWEFRTAAELDPNDLRERYRDACDRSREVVAQASGLDQLSVLRRRNGGHFSLRWVMLHLVEETARHAGHADFLREAVDGSVGE
jgi:uncharacterized damage-inducible protein DinB